MEVPKPPKKLKKRKGMRRSRGMKRSWIKRVGSKTMPRINADSIWSKAIRERDKVCQMVGCNNVSEHSHHIFSRKIKSLRYNLLNGIGLCAECHDYAHGYPVQFREYLQWFLGVRYTILKELAR